MIVQTDIFDQGYQRQVYGIAVQAPPSQPWSASTANSICRLYMPPDAVYQSQVPLSNGVDKIYYSASLAKAFPASAFVNASQNAVKPGLFDVMFLYTGNASHIDSCYLQIGTQQTAA